MFSVKSTYRYHQEARDAVSNVMASDFWKKLWKLRVPPKVKNLLWRAASNCLPTKTMLRSKHVQVDSLCPLCQQQRESISHCLVQCSFARSCWARVDVETDMEAGISFATWLDGCLKLTQGETRKMIAMVCWTIWTAQNDQVWNNKGATFDGVIGLAYTTLDQWSKAQDRNKISEAAFLTAEDGSERWSKPISTILKINVDAALFAEMGKYSYACVVRDSRGQFLEAISSCKQGMVNPEMAEVLGVREALSWIKRKSWQRVVVESDSLLVIQSIRSSVSMMSYFGSIVEECRSMLKELPEVKLLFIRRSANSVVHHIARVSYYVADLVVRSVDVSPDLLDVIMQDCS